MIRGHVQSGEVVEIGFYFGALGNLEPHVDEYVLESLPGLRHDVRVPTRTPCQMLGEIHRFVGCSVSGCCSLERNEALSDQRF